MQSIGTYWNSKTNKLKLKTLSLNLNTHGYNFAVINVLILDSFEIPIEKIEAIKLAHLSSPLMMFLHITFLKNSRR